MGLVVVITVLVIVYAIARALMRAGNAVSPNAGASAIGAPRSSSSNAAENTARWIAPSGTVEIAGVSVAGGMIYVGRTLRTSIGTIENCLINPSLPVSRSRADGAGALMPYWPSYSTIQPSARRAYLQWLAEGRRNPDAYIGYVFLFFYGLERRLFLERALHDGPAILSEVKRLRSIYGANTSFRAYSQAFIDAAQIVLSEAATRPRFKEIASRNYEMSLEVRRYLGAELLEGVRLDADDALAWVLALPDMRLGALRERCLNEFTDLWRTRFNTRWPGGLRVRTPKARLNASYRAASGTFTADLDIGHLPDVAAIIQPIQPLRELAETLSAELGNYARFLVRCPNGGGSLEAACLLPRDLWSTQAGQPLMAARRALEANIQGDELTSLPVAEVCRALGVSAPAGEERFPIAFERSIAGTLDAMDLGFEPDRRYGASGLSHTGAVILFRAPGGGGVDPNTEAYAPARALVEITALAAAADDGIAAEEVDMIETELSSIEGLSALEQRRLQAHARALLADPPKQQGAFNRLAKLGASERHKITGAAIGAVLADGRVTASEIKFLERLYKALGLPKEELYAALHRGAKLPDEPVSISVEARAPGVAIPPLAAAPSRPAQQSPAAAPSLASTTAAPQPRSNAAPPSAPIIIDPHRLKRVVRETAQVSALLADIFAEDGHGAAKVAATPRSQTFPGLDAAHGALLTALLATPGIDRQLFEDKARTLRLMPDGAIETINDWAFENFDEPLLEDGEIVAPAPHLLAKVEALGVRS